MDTPLTDLSLPTYWKSVSLIREAEFKSSLSGGKGGQHVNKVSSRIELYWNPANSYVLSEEQKAKVLAKLGSKLSKEGVLRIVSDEERSQIKNKETAIEKFYQMVAACFKEKKKRKPTKKTKASVEKRLTTKGKRSNIKSNRKKPDY